MPCNWLPSSNEPKLELVSRQYKVVLVDGGQGGDHEAATETRWGGDIDLGDSNSQVITPRRKLVPDRLERLTGRAPRSIAVGQKVSQSGRRPGTNSAAAVRTHNSTIHWPLSSSSQLFSSRIRTCDRASVVDSRQDSASRTRAGVIFIFGGRRVGSVDAAAATAGRCATRRTETTADGLSHGYAQTADEDSLGACDFCWLSGQRTSQRLRCCQIISARFRSEIRFSPSLRRHGTATRNTTEAQGNFKLSQNIINTRSAVSYSKPTKDLSMLLLILLTEILKATPSIGYRSTGLKLAEYCRPYWNVLRKFSPDGLFKGRLWPG